MIITGGVYKGRKVIAPDENITRPTLSKVRMGVFNTLYSIMSEFEGKSFLDLFGGSGIMGLEALSRGFKTVTVYEKNPKVAQIIKNNYQALKLTPNLLIGDSLKLLEKQTTIFDVVYIDPPYSSNIYTEIFKKNIIKMSKIIIAEYTSEPDFEELNIIKIKNYGGKKVAFLFFQN